MTQQLAIIVLVDVGNALASKSLDGNVYLFDNMKLHGSEGQGTGDLVTVLNGSYWNDGSQGTELVLNWLPYALGSIPPTVPRGYQALRARQSDQEALAGLAELEARPARAAAGAGAAAAPAGEAELRRIRRAVGTPVGTVRRSRGPGARKVLDLTGGVVADAGAAVHSYPAPVITDITGEAVDQKIMYPAEYGSPDLVTDGWYWSATVDSARPGTYEYTMSIQVHDLVQQDGGWVWQPVDLSCRSRIRVTSLPKRNGFTKGGMGLLPLAPPAPPAVP
ncbi:hypothetical protein ACIRBX_03895 [Kitasatospora sp. NPDC096147]|uniref:hypothetical protein n=1 Tax=Kitasatospora sp. NPDC096147 TaxID=3364093 RepID=UPI00382F07B0